jgi:hypothetical protein
VTPEQDRFGPEQVQAPETVLGVPQEREPRRTVLLAVGSIVCSQNAADHILVQVGPKGLARCCAIFGQPKRGLRRLSSQMARINSGEGPFGPGFFFGREE